MKGKNTEKEREGRGKNKGMMKAIGSYCIVSIQLQREHVHLVVLHLEIPNNMKTC